MSLGVLTKNMIVWIWYKEICQHLKDLQNSLNSTFKMTNECTVLENHAQIKDPFKV